MLFEKEVRVEPIPERVLELCRLVNRGTQDQSTLKEMIEPSFLNSAETSYFNYIRNAAVELNLIRITDDKKLCYVAAPAVIADFSSFRRYCNSVVWRDPNTMLYKCSVSFLESNDRWLQYKTLTDIEIIREISARYNSKLANTNVLATRFWLSFLGFGFIYETKKGMNFLPNMYVALKDFLVLSKVEPGREYSIQEFLTTIGSISNVAFTDAPKTQTLNLALSNALRQMHDRKEIELQRNLDSEMVWKLFENKSHQFTAPITHIVYKGVIE